MKFNLTNKKVWGDLLKQSKVEKYDHKRLKCLKLNLHTCRMDYITGERRVDDEFQ